MRPLVTAQVPRRFVRSHWGGTETVILETSKQLIAMGHPTEIVTSLALTRARRERLDGVPVTRLPYGYPYLGLSREARQRLDHKGGNLFSRPLMGHLRRLPRLDLLHLHTGKRMAGCCRLVARQRRIPYVVSLHGGVHDVPGEEAASWTEPTRGCFEWGRALGLWVGSRRVLDDAAMILCVGQRETELTRQRYPQRKVVHLPNGVDIDRFAGGVGARFRAARGIPAEAELLLVVGRIDPQKNQRLAVELLARLLPDHPRLHLALVGHVTHEAYAARLEAEIAASGAGDRVTLIRGLDAAAGELVDAFAAADVFLLPSIHEPFGIVVLEAWAAGRPVAASRVGGLAALVEDGRTGVLFDPADADQAAAALRPLLRDPARRQALGEAGRRHAEDTYSWPRVTARLVELYREAIDQDPRRQR